MRILIIGLGSIAEKHLNALRILNYNVEVYALRSSHSSQLVDDVQSVYSLEDVKNIDFDFCIVCNPTSMHAKIIDELISYEWPLFIEKPIFDSLNHRSLVSKLEKSNIINYVACNLRFLESIEEIKKRISSKQINEVNIYCGSYLPDWRPNKDYKTAYSANVEMGGGVHLDLIHELDYCYWIFGQPEDVKSVKKSSSSLGISAFDFACYNLIYSTFTSTITLNYYRRDAKRTMEILCSDGTFLIDLLKNSITWNGEIVFSDEHRISNTYTKQLQFFIEEILTQNQVFNSASEAFEILKICMKED